MNNKIIIFIIGILFITAIMNISLTKADLDNACFPTVALVSQDPAPAIPGSYANVVFEVSNIASQECENGLAVRLKMDYPFSLDPGVNPIQTLGSVPYAKDYKQAWTVPYKLRVADDAVEGDYNLTLQYHVGNAGDFNSSYIENKFNITIQDSRTSFDAVIQEATSSTVSIAIANTGKYTANSVVVRIPEQDNYRITGTDGQMVGNLNSGDYTIVAFNIARKLSMQQQAQTGTGNA